ncbi:MAG: PorV/PorQ family protein [Bacteroidota bacterium]
MKHFAKHSFVIIALSLFSVSVYAQKVGSTSMQFLKVIPSAKGTGMGDAYAVRSSGVDALFWNPSGIISVKDQEIASTYINWIFDTQQGALSYAASLDGYGAIGVQLQYVDYGEFIETTEQQPYVSNFPNQGITGNTFRPYSYLVGISYAQNLTDKFTTGVSVKYAHESLYNGNEVTALVSTGVYENVKTWANGLMFDLGIKYNTGFRSIQIGASVQNFGTNVTYAKESNPIPMMFRFGIAADILGVDPLLAVDNDNRLGIEFDLFQPNDYAQQEHIGMEYEYAGMFTLRAGYKFNYDVDGLTLGGGVKQSFSSVMLSIDYSYSPMGTYLGNTHRFSLGVEL